eukprot:6947911-Pyramimonas_sp.AAC.1
MKLIRKLPQSITLNTAGGEPKALGSVRIACPKFEGGSFNAWVMPETPCVISVGERPKTLPILAQRSKSGPDR